MTSEWNLGICVPLFSPAVPKLGVNSKRRRGVATLAVHLATTGAVPPARGAHHSGGAWWGLSG